MQNIKDWPEEICVIRCSPLSAKNAFKVNPPSCNLIQCDVCDATVLATELTKSKQTQPGWKIVCRACYEFLPSKEVHFCGTIMIGQTELPSVK